MLSFASRVRIVSARAQPLLRSKPRPQSFGRSRTLTTKKSEPEIPLPENPFGKNAQARAKQMHNEIENIVKKHDEKRGREAEKVSRVSGFFDFMSQNKTNLSIIVVSFLTLFLSVKMVQNKQKYEEQNTLVKESEAQLDEKRKLLKSIASEEFLSKMAQNCATKLDSNSQSKGGWGLGRPNKGNNAEATILAVLKEDLNAFIGDAGLSDDEKQAKEFEALRASSLPDDDAAIEKLSAQSEKLAAEEEQSEGEVVVEANGTKKVKKSVFVI